jgi:CBS domain-containing protein
MNLVLHILDDAQRRLAILKPGAPAIDAAVMLSNPKTPLVVVCDAAGIATGVVSRMDVVKLFGRSKDDAAFTPVAEIMTRTFVSCRENQTLQSVWKVMCGRALRSMPVLDENGRPRGALHARDLVRALLDEVTTEEMLLRDYVLGVGYR